MESQGFEVLREHRIGFFWSLRMALFWATGRDLRDNSHPLMRDWDRTWNTLLDTPDGARIKKGLDQILPKNHLIIARKSRRA